MSFVDADGAIHKSDMMVLDTEFTHIVAETLRSRYPDVFFIAAYIKTDSISVFDGSRFSPCDCEFENGETPIWTSGRHRPPARRDKHDHPSQCPHAYS